MQARVYRKLNDEVAKMGVALENFPLAGSPGIAAEVRLEAQAELIGGFIEVHDRLHHALLQARKKLSR